jgi:hypothetical protein
MTGFVSPLSFLATFLERMGQVARTAVDDFGLYTNPPVFASRGGDRQGFAILAS